MTRPPQSSALLHLLKAAADLPKRYLDPDRRAFASFQPEGPARGTVLLAHVVEGVLAGPDDPLIRRHNHFVEARLMVEALRERGYAVDVISWRNAQFRPKRRYDLFIGPRENFEVLAGRMEKDCIRIVHLETAHWLANNAAALARLREVQARRSVALTSIAQLRMNRAIEEATAATMLGNDVVYETYAFAGKRIYQVPNPGTILHPWIEDRDFAQARTRFLWLGSTGLVHKGLDVVLEAFARMPEFHLTVCGPVDRDPHFASAFAKELHETPNIRTHGWVDLAGPDFAAIRAATAAHVYPTCADACCGSVINAMHAGLIPLATPEAGVDINPSFGMSIPSPTAEAVEATVRRLAGMSPPQVAAMARAAWEEARRVYGHDSYRRAFGDAVEAIVAEHPRGATRGFVLMKEGGLPRDDALTLSGP
jgi:glycosyltransferase involved in cell wall biosynthesis